MVPPPVVVLTTGGTIASRSAPGGARVAVTGAELVGGPVRDVLAVDSSALTFTDLDVLRDAVGDALDGGAAGVVVTHGTDTMEETALLLDLGHDDARPVVLTGAARPADDPDPDGPANLRDAVSVAADRRARGLGVLVVLGGVAHAARHTRKLDTRGWFADPRAGAVGMVAGGGIELLRRPPRAPALRFDRLARVRVDVVALYPGADATALDAHVDAGAHGLVLEATGSGNTHPVVVAAVARHVRAGVAVVVSTRVPAGPVEATYGGGGGAVDLVAAGAVVSRWRRPGQARVQLAALLAAGAGPDAVAVAFRE